MSYCTSLCVSSEARAFMQKCWHHTQQAFFSQNTGYGSVVQIFCEKSTYRLILLLITCCFLRPQQARHLRARLPDLKCKPPTPTCCFLRARVRDVGQNALAEPFSCILAGYPVYPIALPSQNCVVAFSRGYAILLLQHCVVLLCLKHILSCTKQQLKLS